MSEQYRQGDVFLQPVAEGEIPEGERKQIAPVNGRVVLAEGEVTGHNHTMSAETATMELIDGRVLLTVAEPTPLTHQEHGEIEVKPGMYWVVPQREYQPEAVRRVAD